MIFFYLFHLFVVRMSYLCAKLELMKRFLSVFFTWVALSFLLVAFSCKNTPSAVEQRKAEIRRNDSLELEMARAELLAADSLATFVAFELEDLKPQFVFEKQEKYQTQGYYVLPAYQGDKSRFTFFPEVEEKGALLLVTIDTRRQYSFQEIDLDAKDYTTQLPSGLSDAVKKDIAQCYMLAKTMHDLESAQKKKEKMTLKVRFYEEKMKRGAVSTTK